MLALGPHLKNTVAVAVRGRAIASGDVGDLDHPLAVDACRGAAADLVAMWEVAPEHVACDAHPDYTSTRLAEAHRLPIVRVQHHLAHALAIVADCGLTGPVCAVVWDGTGAGPDGSVWGGEVLVTSGDRTWRRFAHLRRFRMPGGDATAREAFRSAAAFLHELDLPWTPPAELGAAAAQVIKTMLARGVNAPWTSSAGRLFDGVASLLDVCQRQSYEGQAAIRLEALVDRGFTCVDPYPLAIVSTATRRPSSTGSRSSARSSPIATSAWRSLGSRRGFTKGSRPRSSKSHTEPVCARSCSAAAASRIAC